MNQVDVKNMQRKHRFDSARLQALGVRALDMLGFDSVQLSVAVVNDRRIRELNRTYRGKDSATDVLAFSQREGEGEDLHGEVLGDVVISAETAARQAVEAGQSLQDEFHFLAVHGILHLAGFDHVGSAAERAKMTRWAKRILGGRHS